MTTKQKTTSTAASTTAAAPATVSAAGERSAELRVTVSVTPDETTEYTIVPIGGGDKPVEYNVTPAHDPNGGFVLEQHAKTPDAAIHAFISKFDKEQVAVSGAGDVYAVVSDGKVLAVEKTRDAAVAAADKLANAGDGGGLTGNVHPATSAVKEAFDALGTEGTRITVHGGGGSGVVTLAR